MTFRGEMDDDRLILIDGSSYIYRAFHSLPALTRARDGLPIGAVYGFAGMLVSLLREQGDDYSHIAVVFDAPSKTFRSEIYPAYKGNRPPVKPELRSQFSLCRDAVRAFGIACVEQDGFEADDLIATYARCATDAGGTAVLVTPDKDMAQLVSDAVTIWNPMAKSKVERVLGRTEVIKKHGVAPEKFADMQALLGDTVDNIPGVPGIGPVRASKLINEFGSLEVLLARISEVTPERIRVLLWTYRAQIETSRRLVALDRNVPVTTPYSALRARLRDHATLFAWLDDMEFASIKKRLMGAANA